MPEMEVAAAGPNILKEKVVRLVVAATAGKTAQPALSLVDHASGTGMALLCAWRNAQLSRGAHVLTAQMGNHV